MMNNYLFLFTKFKEQPKYKPKIKLIHLKQGYPFRNPRKTKIQIFFPLKHFSPTFLKQFLLTHQRKLSLIQIFLLKTKKFDIHFLLLPVKEETYCRFPDLSMPKAFYFFFQSKINLPYPSSLNRSWL